MKKEIKYTVLGSGTSSGIPTIGCKCPTCTSDDINDKRLRCSLLVESANTRVVIDSGPDFRQQMLKYNVDKLDAVVYTHHHFDHIGGFDDIRAFNYHTRKPMPLFIDRKTLTELKRTFIYAFETPEQMGGGVPLIDINLIDEKEFFVKDLKFLPIPLCHGKLNVLGFRIGDLAYCTDTNNIPDRSYKLLEDLDVLIIDALRYTDHSTHFNLEQAVAEIEKISPKMAYLTHIAHQIKHKECEAKLPGNIRIAYDGLTLYSKRSANG